GRTHSARSRPGNQALATNQTPPNPTTFGTHRIPRASERGSGLHGHLETSAASLRYRVTIYRWPRAAVSCGARRCQFSAGLSEASFTMHRSFYMFFLALLLGGGIATAQGLPRVFVHPSQTMDASNAR